MTGRTYKKNKAKLDLIIENETIETIYFAIAFYF